MENTSQAAMPHGSPLRSGLPKTLRQRFRALQTTLPSLRDSDTPETLPVFGIGAWPDAWYFSYSAN